MMADRKTENKGNMIAVVVQQLLCFLFSFLICFLCNLPLIDGLKYFLFQLCAVAVPGAAIELMIGFRRKDLIEAILNAYIFGLTLLMMEYLLLMVLKIPSLSLLLSFLLLIGSVFVIFRNKERLSELKYDKNWIWLYPIVCLLAVVCFFSIAYSNISPDTYGGTVYDKDFLFWVGNCLSFVKGLPVQNYRLVGEKFYYHFFSNVVIAQTFFISGIEVVELCFYFSYIIPCFLLVFSAYVFLRSVIDQQLFVFIGMILILLIDGLTVYLPDHLYFCPFGYDYAYALSMVSFVSLIRVYKEDHSIREFVVSCIMLMLTTGFKGPNGVVVLCAYGIIAFAMLLEKKWKKGFIYGILWLASFLIIYFLFITDIHATGRTNNLEFVGILGGFDSNPLAIKILSKLISAYSFPDNGISRILALLLYIVLNNVGAIFLLAFSMIALIIAYYRKENIAIISSLIVTSLWGIILTLITHQDGNSQMYFIMSTLPFCTLAGLYGAEMIFTERRVMIAFAIAILIISFSDIRRFFDYCINTNISNAFLVQNGGVAEDDHRYYFSKEEYELALWLKENTDEYDYIALDLFAYDGLRKEEMMGVFSQRFIWNDGQYSTEEERDRRRNIVNDLMSGNDQALQKLKSENVRYLIQTLSQNPELVLDEKMIVYEKDGYRVYRLYEA